MKKGKYQQAFNSFKRLRHTEVIAARDLYYAHVQLAAENRIIQGKTYISRFTELFTIPRVRRGTLAASVVMLAQQMCGINIIAFYSSTIFLRSGYSASQALYASLGFGAVNFVFAWPAIFTIDTCEFKFLRKKRKFLIIQSVEDHFFSPLSPTWLGHCLQRECVSSFQMITRFSRPVLSLCKFSTRSSKKLNFRISRPITR